MERLTYKKTLEGFSFYKIKPDVGEDAKAQKWNYYDALNKLGQLEDIEEELGIDLVTLFKALKNGVYVKFENNVLYRPSKYLNINENRLFCGVYFLLEDYGKTWALTKEELE